MRLRPPAGPQDAGSGIVGGEAAALLFAFALLAAMTLRTDLAAARRRLAWYGARGWQLALVTVAESAALALAGTVLGLAVGALGGAFVAHRAGAACRGDPVSQRFLGPGARARGARCGGCDGVFSWRPWPPARLRPAPARFSLVDAAALAAVLLVLLELWRGDDEGDLVLLLPALVTFAAAVLVGRAAATCAAAGRAARRAAGRSGCGSRPFRSRAIRATRWSRPRFSSSASALRSSPRAIARRLPAANADQAAHRVPLDYVVREDLRRLIPVQDAASLDRFARARRGGRTRSPRDRERWPARGGERNHAARAAAVRRCPSCTAGVIPTRPHPGRARATDRARLGR